MFQPIVRGVAYIGIIAPDSLIGLSKYTRIAQWCAARGTLQEELANDIAREIQKATGAQTLRRLHTSNTWLRREQRCTST